MTKHLKTFDQDHLRNVTHVVFDGQRWPVQRAVGSDHVLIVVPPSYTPPPHIIATKSAFRLAGKPNDVLMTVSIDGLALVRNGGTK